MPIELLLTDAVRSAIEALPEFQAERALSVRDGWQRHFPIGKLSDGEMVYFLSVSVLPEE